MSPYVIYFIAIPMFEILVYISNLSIEKNMFKTIIPAQIFQINSILVFRNDFFWFPLAHIAFKYLFCEMFGRLASFLFLVELDEDIVFNFLITERFSEGNIW